MSFFITGASVTCPIERRSSSSGRAEMKLSSVRFKPAAVAFCTGGPVPRRPSVQYDRAEQWYSNTRQNDVLERVCPHARTHYSRSQI